MDELKAAPDTELNDAALAALLREQSPSALAVLYDRYGRLVFSLALRIVGDHGAAEEITQDVFLRCWNSSARFQPERGSLATWLLTIAHRRSVDELRSRRGKAFRTELSVDELWFLATRDPALDDALLSEEVRKSLSSLPDVQRNVIELIYWGGLSRREAADELGVPIGTVHTRLRLGMAKLRTVFSRFFTNE